MRYKTKRILIGLVIPTIAAAMICGVFYYKNVHVGFVNEIKKYEDDTSEQMKGIVIRKDNWQDYFTLETRVELIKNEAGELEKVQYVNCLSLKEEYRTKLTTERDSIVNITGKQPSERMKYEIVDPKAGEWELTGKLISEKPKGEVDVKQLVWNSALGTVYEAAVELDSGEYMGQIFLQVPEEFEVEAVAGELYLVK